MHHMNDSSSCMALGMHSHTRELINRLPFGSGTLEDPVLRSGARAKQYPFVLDPFQETAIACLVRGIPH